MTATAKIRLAFSSAFVLFVAVAATVAIRTLRFEHESAWIERSHEAVDELSALALDSERLAQGQAVGTNAVRRAETVEELLRDTPVQHENAAVLLALIRQQAMLGARSQELRSEVFTLISRMSSEEHRLLAVRIADQKEALLLSRIFSAGGMVLAFGFFALAGLRVVQDTKYRAEIERQLALREEQYRQVIELAGDLIFRTDPEGRFAFCNQACLSMLYYTREEVIGRSYLRLVRQDKRREVERFYLRQVIRKQRSTYLEFPIVDGHGRVRWIGQNAQLLMENGRPSGFQAIARDITERKQAETDLQKSRNFIEKIAATTPGILYVYDLDDRRNVFSNREVISVLGFRPDESRNSEKPASFTVHPDDQSILAAHYASMRHAQDGEIRRLEYRARHTNGHWVWLSGRETPFERDAYGQVKQVVGISQDITARKAAQEKLTYQANYDALTGLPNRHFLWTRLQGILRRCSIDFSETSLCIFDIDRFKEINDRFGHAAGDEVLEEVGNLVRAELRPADLAGRLGGDEFCFVLPGTDPDEAARVADRIRERLCTLAFGIGSDTPFSVTATFGVALSKPDMDAKELMEAADRALYRAKSAGRNRVCQDA